MHIESAPHLIIFDFNQKISISSLMVLMESHNFLLAGRDGSIMFYHANGNTMPGDAANVLFKANADNEFVTLPFKEFELIAA